MNSPTLQSFKNVLNVNTLPGGLAASSYLRTFIPTLVPPSLKKSR
jgi:hypothetical protein